MKTTLAIDIGGTNFSLALFEGEKMVRHHRQPTDATGGRDWMLERLEEVVREWRAAAPIDRCGIGFGGPVIFSAQRVALSTHVGGWSDFDFPGWVRERFGIPAIVDNDANVGALGEARYGAGGDPLFFMTLSTGIGGGIVIDGKIFRGADSYAGELGHLTIHPDGPECLCGARGCFERHCSGLWLARDHGREARELLQDPAFVRRYVVDLALGLKACIMMLNPARIVIGGGLGKAGDALFVPLREELARQMTPWSRARVEVVPTALGDHYVLYGALALAE